MKISNQKKYLQKIIPILGLCLIFFTHAQPINKNPSTEEIETIKLPPRDIKDILKVLAETKQDLKLEEKAKGIIAKAPPLNADAETLNAFYYRRAIAYETLGNVKAAAEDLNKVVEEYPSREPTERAEELFNLANFESAKGNYLYANTILEKSMANIPRYSRGWVIAIYRQFALNSLAVGDFDAAKNYLATLETTLNDLMTNARNAKYEYRLGWQLGFEWTRARVFLQEGKFIEAERSFQKALKLNQENLNTAKGAGQDALDNEKRILQDNTTNLRGQYGVRIMLLSGLATSYLGQKKITDAEYYARESLMLSINRYGVYSIRTSSSLLTLTRIISEQGRQAEAVLLANAALKITQEISDFPGSPFLAEVRRAMATALVADGKYIEAQVVFAEMLQGVQSDPEVAKKYQTGDLDWSLAMIKTGKSDQAIQMTKQMLDAASTKLDKNSARLALIRAFHASALQTANQYAQALAEFKLAMPILIAQTQLNSENSTNSIRQTQRMNFVFEEYLATLAYQAKTNASESIAKEAFQIADLARGSGVQKALTASAARATITDPQLAKLARDEQDLKQRMSTLAELLTGLLSAPPDQQLPAVQNKIRADIATFNTQRQDLKKEIERKFPDYANLVDPKPASVEAVQKVLKDDEVLLSWYFSDTAGYVWGITKQGAPTFIRLAISKNEVAKEVADLRKALDPNAVSIETIPAFDVPLAHKLYSQVLAPVESLLVGKRLMISVPHGDLAQLPLALLVTKPTPQPVRAPIQFVEYRSIPWLAKDISITQIPSVTALVSLRSLPIANQKRKNFIGFGDPFFSVEQQQEATKLSVNNQLTSRGSPVRLRSVPKTRGVSSAELALLPRLADTTDELLAVGKAMGATPDDIFLHENASVKRVTSMDLSDRKVVMFSTHGLVPGDLNGLTQPALALSSPSVTGDKDDGLLTMDKVISLKLDADWVVLSACNTAAGDGAGTESISGLGKAFFFAGARALLVSNWPVDSDAARVLMTDLFKIQNQSENPKINQVISKSESLQQSMMYMVNNGGLKEGNVMKYSYAHPLFWAPFVMVGD